MLSFMLEVITFAVKSVRAYVTRSILSSIGIAVSVATLIAVVSMIEGFSANIQKQFEGFGTDSITVQPKIDFAAQLKGKHTKLALSDMDLIHRQVGYVTSITPEMTLVGRYQAQASYLNMSTSTDVRGTTASWMELFRRYPELGRFLLQSDEVYKRKVCVLGEQVRKDLELPSNPVGHYITIEGEWFKVVGVLKPQGKSMGFNQDDLIIIPFSTALSMNNHEIDSNFWLQMRVKDLADMNRAVDQITDLLRENHGLTDKENNDFEVQKADQFMDSFRQITTTVMLVLVGIISVSMLVGGIGIMNVMIMSVTERTREIGIAKALGASRNAILGQFICEAIILCMIGGCAGLGLGYLMAHLLALLAQSPVPTLPMWSVFVALSFSMLVGLVFGIVPAAKAANMEPIEALRYNN